MTTSTKPRAIADVAMRQLHNRIIGLSFHAATEKDPIEAERHLDDAIECIHAMRRVLRNGESTEVALGENGAPR